MRAGRDLTGRDVSRLWCEQDDLAARTLSSNQLIHRGLRYLKHCKFALVRQALADRDLWLKSAPHIMWPMRFVMPDGRLFV